MVIDNEDGAGQTPRVLPWAEGESAPVGVDEEQEALKDEEGPEEIGSGVDAAQMPEMVDEAHPEPEQGKNAGDEATGRRLPAKCKNNSQEAQKVGDDRRRPDGDVVGGENVEELLHGKRRPHSHPLRVLNEPVEPGIHGE
jgi:hypothetical protein